jgi:hypothetical protein
VAGRRARSIKPQLYRKTLSSKLPILLVVAKVKPVHGDLYEKAAYKDGKKEGL